MALLPKGQALRWCHRGLEARRLLAREKAEYESSRRPAISPAAVVVATWCWSCRRTRAEGACLAEVATREDSCLDIIVLPSASAKSMCCV